MGVVTPFSLFLFSFSAYIFVFFYLSGIIRLLFLKNAPRATILLISNRLVSALQAFLTFFVGSLIVRNTTDDLIESQYWLTQHWPFIIAGYGTYDVWSMYYCYRENCKEKGNKVDGQQRILIAFCRDRALMLTHHFWLFIVGLPAAVVYRNGKGDFFLGCFFMVELSSPFVMFRAILSELGLKERLLYTVNGLAMIGCFFVCRILMFPFMFHAYANYRNLQHWWLTPLHIPIKCSAGCLCIFALQVYWFIIMIRGAAKVLCGGKAKKSLLTNTKDTDQ